MKTAVIAMSLLLVPTLANAKAATVPDAIKLSLSEQGFKNIKNVELGGFRRGYLEKSIDFSATAKRHDGKMGKVTGAFDGTVLPRKGWIGTVSYFSFKAR
jgi:hypothetical protein